MTNFLLKHFVKDYHDTKDSEIRSKIGVFSSCVGIFCNILIFFIKIAIGLISNSIAIITDSFNNLSDFVSAIVSLLGFNLGKKCPDKEHPFGHGRMEYIASFIISFIILFLGFEFLKGSILKIFRPESMNFSSLVIIILISTVIIKLWLMVFYVKIGKMINSQTLIATSIDSRNDVFITLVTISSLFIYYFFKINLDGYFGVVVALFLIYSGISLFKGTFSQLLGERVDERLEQEIKKIVLSFDGVVGLHELFIHNYGPNKNIATLHIEVTDNTPIKIAHEMTDNIERKVLKELGIFLTIHIDPVDLEDERLINIKNEVDKVLKNTENIFAYDFRIIKREFADDVIFDLSIPYNMKDSQKNEIIIKIKNSINLLDSKYQVSINIINTPN